MGNVLILVNAMHITASVFINDDERGLHQDYDDWLEELAPYEPVSRYRHRLSGISRGALSGCVTRVPYRGIVHCLAPLSGVAHPL